MKLIVEDDLELCRVKVVNESIAKDDGQYHPLKLTGCMARADYKNANNRIYPFPLLKEAMNKYITETVEKKRAWGELEHPGNLRKTELENLEHAAVFINKIELDEENKQWNGEVTVCAADPRFGIPGTATGSLLKSLIFYSGNPNLFGFSTRGFGELTEANAEGTRYLTELTIAGVDVVSVPSCGLMANGIFESKEFMIDMHGKIVECALNDYEKMINSSTKTYDLDKKREIYKAAFDALLKKL